MKMPDEVLGFTKMKTMDEVVDETEFKNRAYRAVIEEFQRLEYHGVYKGNAHHLAQRAVDMPWVEFGVD
jgi:hypothetical protein